ncbi:hypothetical protein HON36_03835 [Candidatus Parcubacteria bacterium]|jgi:hypothetical protein|nr:hypothetical protein [Candidatus Parcubacteria bacterium]MBT7228995.1 hypothetical protein [Candidatus Parcubacteria bacterium]
MDKGDCKIWRDRIKRFKDAVLVFAPKNDWRPQIFILKQLKKDLHRYKINTPSGETWKNNHGRVLRPSLVTETEFKGRTVIIGDKLGANAREKDGDDYIEMADADIRVVGFTINHNNLIIEAKGPSKSIYLIIAEDRFGKKGTGYSYWKE